MKIHEEALQKIPNILRIIAGNFFSAIVNIGVISAHFQLPLSVVLFCPVLFFAFLGRGYSG
jgi:hypothetical protein